MFFEDVFQSSCLFISKKETFVGEYGEGNFWNILEANLAAFRLAQSVKDNKKVARSAIKRTLLFKMKKVKNLFTENKMFAFFRINLKMLELLRSV